MSNINESDTDILNIKLAEVINQLIELTPVNTNCISDGYHTFNELYNFRMVLSAILFNEWYKQGLYVYKTKRDNESNEYKGWFIVVAELPTGQISFHYPYNEGWDLFKIPVKRKVEHYDGHTSVNVLKRLKKYILETY